MVRGETTSTRRKAPWDEKNNEPYQTVGTVYFTLGVLRTDLWSQGTPEIVKRKKKILDITKTSISLYRGSTVENICFKVLCGSEIKKTCNILFIP